MTVSTTYIPKSAKIAGVVCTGFISATLSGSGTPVDLRSDNEIYHRGSPLVNITETLQIELRDITNAIKHGLSGETVLTFSGVADGTGTSVTRTLTCAKTSVQSVHVVNNIDGQATMSVSLQIFSPDGLASGMVWSAA